MRSHSRVFVRTVIALLALAGPVLLQAQQKPPVLLRMDLDGVVHAVTEQFFKAGVERAREIGAEAVIVRLDTPGGLVDSTRGIVETFLTSPVPIVVWVGPSGSRAASAGFFLLLAADLATMAPGTNTGAAHPVLAVGGQLDETMEKKITNDATAFLRSYVGKRGRNAAIAEQGVTESRSFSDTEALQNNLIDAIVKDIPELLRTFHGMNVRRFDGSVQVLRLDAAVIETFEMTDRQKLLSWILNPNVAIILGLLGLLGIYVEITHPGLILPGVAGGISLILALLAFNLLPINLTGVLLILLAVVLFVMEATIVSHGVLAVGGVVAMVIGGVMLVEGPIPELRIQLSTMLAVAIPLALITVFLVRLVLLAQRTKSTTGYDWILGNAGIAETDIHKSGKVMIQGELWNARSREVIPKGAAVRIVGVDGLTLEAQAETEDKR